MFNYFTKHPTDRGMSYITHAFGALKLSFKLALGAIKTTIHALFPFLYEKATTDTLKECKECIENSSLKMDSKS